MSYEYLSALVKPKGKGSQWVEEDISDQTFRSLFVSYRDARVAIDHPSFESDKFFLLDEIRDMIEDPDRTVSQWLSDIGNTTIPTYDGTIELKRRVVDHRDAYMAGYDIRPTRMDSHPDVNWPMDERKDLLLFKDGIDYRKAYRSLLVSVNGLIHRTSYSRHGLYIVDGAYSQKNANRVGMGLTDFSPIGELSFIDIHDKMLYRPTDDHKHYQQAYLNLGQSTENKTVMLVIGGYPHLLDGTYDVVGDGLVKIDFNNYPIIQRYYESLKLIDMDDIEYTQVGNGPDQRKVDDLIRSEKFIRQLMNLSQTFAVVIDSDQMYVEKHSLEKTGLPGCFLSQQRPTLPFVSLRGKWIPYWTHLEDDVWVVNCGSNYLPNYQFEHGPYQNQYCVTTQKVPNKPFYQDRGYLLEIGCYV